MDKYTKLLLIEDGSVDVEELKQGLLEDIKIVVYRQGSQKPELLKLIIEEESKQ